MPDWQDAEVALWLQKAKNGDVEAYGLLYEAYAPQVFRYLYAHLDDRLDAEDLTGEVFLRAWQALPGYRPQGVPFAGFLFRVARNALYDHYRSSRRRRPDLELMEEHRDESNPDPAQELAANWQQGEVQKMLKRLSQDYRTVLSLRFLAGLTPEETAQAMERSAGAVRVLQHRALTALRKLLAEDEKEDK
ncbi:MAG: RNA polymerase sigma factor [Anaerolineales bacterium]|nr:RNA polymerase sigma factor [Anaerolineales bacterium]